MCACICVCMCVCVCVYVYPSGLLEAFAMLKSNTSQEGLREFLTILKQHEQQVCALFCYNTKCQPQGEI